MTVRVGKSVNENILCGTIVDKQYQAHVQNKDEHATGVKDPAVDPVSEQSQTLVEESDVEGATSEEIENKKPKEYMTQGQRFTIFTHERIYPQEEPTPSPGEDLTARQRLGYEYMASHEYRIGVEEDEA
jgi:hypothetical protein